MTDAADIQPPFGMLQENLGFEKIAQEKHRRSIGSPAALLALFFFDLAACRDLADQPDASRPADALSIDQSFSNDAGARFPCGMSTCSVQNEFCYEIAAGISMTREAFPFPNGPYTNDGGSGGETTGCNPMPSSCQAAPTCPCIVGTIQSCPSHAAFCHQDRGGFIVVCALP